MTRAHPTASRTEHSSSSAIAPNGNAALSAAEMMHAFARAAAIEPSVALEAIVTAAWLRARTAHPELAADAPAFFAFAGAQLGAEAAALDRRHVADLYLAWACDRGDSRALAILEAKTLPAVERKLASFPERGEAMQILRERMLVGKPGDRGIAGYDGRAPLVTWFRVCATRIARREQDRERRVVQHDEPDLDELAPGVPDPELAYLRRLYGAAFETAFAAAVASLGTRERNLLRLSVQGGLGIDQLAAIFHVHRATAARQLRAARETLVTATRDHMCAVLAISPSEVESVMRIIRGMTDLTLRHALASEI
jgi:RNA polymerase sigma-70 factor (ECF subfamily)